MRVQLGNSIPNCYNWYQISSVTMVSTKELETCMEFYEKNLFDHQESMQKMLETVQISIESLTVAIAAMNAGKKIMNDEDHHSETPETVLSIVDRVHIPFLSFDGSNFQD